MGLDCSHDAWHGAYSAFNRLRQFVCHATGGSFPPHWEYDENGFPIEDHKTRRLKIKDGFRDGWYQCGNGINNEDWPGLFEFLSHSDCDGEISPESCVLVANDLERLLPEMEKIEWVPRGHIEANGGYVSAVKTFIAGCRKAAENNEPLLFR